MVVLEVFCVAFKKGGRLRDNEFGGGDLMVLC